MSNKSVNVGLGLASLSAKYKNAEAVVAPATSPNDVTAALNALSENYSAETSTQTSSFWGEESSESPVEIKITVTGGRVQVGS